MENHVCTHTELVFFVDEADEDDSVGLTNVLHIPREII